MNRHMLLGLIAGVMLLAGNVGAKEISLDTGETYRQGDLTITCGQPFTDDMPLAINNCQHWDDFNQKCLFEKTTFTYKNLECLEECQYWDKFSSICHYRTKCAFFAPQNLFVQTTCAEFDDFSNSCVKKRDIKIGP